MTNRYRPRAAWLALAVASAAWIAAAIVTIERGGLRVAYFAPPDSHTPRYVTVDRNVTTESITQYAPIPPESPFTARWFGYLYIPRSSVYIFTLTAAGAATLEMDRAEANDSRTLHRLAPLDGPVMLDAGAHAVLLTYTHVTGRYGIEVQTARVGESMQRLPSTHLSRTPQRPIVYAAADWLKTGGVLIAIAWLCAAVVWLMRRVQAWTAAAVVGTGGAFVVAVIWDSPAWLRGPPQWIWPYHIGSRVIDVTMPILAAAAVLALMAYLTVCRTHAVRRARIGLVLAPMAAAMFQLSMLHLEGGGAAATLARQTMSVGVTSYFTVATGESTSTVDFLASYVRALPDLPMHAATHPPGPVLYYRSLIDASRATPRLTGAIVRGLAAVGVQPDRLAASGERHSPTVAVAALAGGFGTVAAAALTGWAVAAMVALAGADALAAAQVAVLWAFCPAAVFFSPMFDQIVMFLVAACAACACASALARRRWIVVAAGLGSGVSAGLALFSSFGAAPMLAAAGILTIVLTRGRGASWRRVIAVAALAAAGAALVFGGPILAGYDEIAAARVALRVHFDRFMAGRSRWVWLRFNLLDFSIFLGWPLIAWGAVHLARGGTMSTRWPFRARPLWTMIAVVVALDLADVTRGEVGRLWMPLMPLFYAAAAVAAIDLAARADSSNDAGRRTASLERLLVAVSLAAATITLGLYWAP